MVSREGLWSQRKESIAMLHYFLNCRSLTYAQRTANVLERSGMSVSIRRTPKAIAGAGCGYSVKIGSRSFASAIQILEQHQLLPKSVYLHDGDGNYREVAM